MLKDADRSVLNKEDRSKIIKYFIVYTFLFAVTALLVNITFIREGITYVRSVDGYSQHIIALEYYGQWLRDFFDVLFNQHRFEFKNFDFSIGLGSDVITTLNYYAIGDPLNLLSVFVKRENTAYLYTVLTVLRMYLSGFSFSLYCLQRKHKSFCGLLAGALLYAFSVYAVIAGTMHPFFINPMIYMPLIFLSVEKIFDNKNPVYLALAVCVAQVSNFYFFYMLVFTTVAYVLLRLFTIYGTQIKKMLLPLMKITVSSFTGVLMGAVVFYPVVMAFLSDGRAAVTHTYPLFYNLRFYLQLLTAPVYYNPVEPWTLVGTGVLMLYAVVALFLKRKSNTSVKAAFLICLSGICLPIFGGFSNGFSYASNRWSFVFTFVIAFMCSLLWEDILFAKSKLKSFLVSFVPVFYVGCCFYVPYASHGRLKYSFVFFSLVSLIIIVSAFAVKGRTARRFVETAVIVINVIFIALNSFLIYGKTASHYYSQQDINNAFSKEYEAVKKQTELTHENGFFRYTSNRLKYNDNTRTGSFATQYYWSLSDRNISDFQDSVYLNEGFYQQYNGFDDIAVFNTLSSVKYYYKKNKYPGTVPYGFANTQVKNLYENMHALPLVYGYDCYAEKQDYDKLGSSPEKQQMMLSAAVLEKTPDITQKQNVACSVIKPEFEITPDSQFVTVEGNTFTVTKKNSTVTLFIKNTVSGEAYLSLRDIKFYPTRPSELYDNNKEVDPFELFGENNIELTGASSLAELKAKPWQEPEHIDFITNASNGTGICERRMCVFWTPSYRFYAGKKDCDFYLGYSEDGFDKVELTFSEIGRYTFGEMSLIMQDMGYYSDAVKKLSRGIVAQINTDTDTITVDACIETNKLLCFSVPYSKGWSVSVDGESKELLKANIMHMAVEVPAGEHKIVLRYSSPYMKTGAVISLAGFVLLAVLYLWYYRQRIKIRAFKRERTYEN